jgi:hypothetical protein
MIKAIPPFFLILATTLCAPAQQPHKPRLITVDDFSVPDAFFHHCDGCTVKSGPVETTDHVWFTNKTLRQTLVFCLYTDGFHQGLYLFSNDDIPTAIIDSMEIIAGNELATNKQKEKYFRGFLPKATPIAAKYFRSEKGFILGDSSEKAIKAYGKPQRRTLTAGITVLSWTFTGENAWDGKTDLHGTPLAANNFGHQLTLCFRNNRLIGLAINNWVP